MENELIQSKSFTDNVNTMPAIRGFAGAITGNNGTELYAIDGTGVLWRNILNTPGWTNLGLPAQGVGINLNTVVGALFANGYAYVFVVGNDGNLYQWTAASGAATWTNLGGNSNFTIPTPVGVVNWNGNNNVYIMGMNIAGGAMNLWLYTNNGWLNLGAPQGGTIGAPGGAIVTGLGNPYAFTLGGLATGGGCAWYNQWNGNAYVWQSAGMDPENFNNVNHINSINLRDGNAYTFFTAMNSTDGAMHVCCNCHDGGWGWQDCGVPTGTTIKSGFCSIAITGGDSNPYVFLQCNDNNMWCCTFNNGWVWQNMGAPAPGLNVNLVLNSAAVPGSAIPTLFMPGNDGNIYMASSDGNNWSWSVMPSSN
ncbi:MAG: hypothetical protein V4649_02915 [Bacteroidota bacterium]